MLGGNAGAGVLDSQPDIVAGGDHRQLVVRDRTVLGKDRDRAPGRHRVAGIDDQVNQREFELRLVGENGPDVRFDPPFEIDQAAERVGEEVGDRVAQ